MHILAKSRGGLLMYRILFLGFLFLLFFGCTTTGMNYAKLNKFMDPDTGVETVETIISFKCNDDHDLIAFNQTKNLKNISWYIICKFCPIDNSDFKSVDIETNGMMSANVKVGGSYNSYDIKTTNTSFLRTVDYFKINESIIADINKCKTLKLIFKGEEGSKELYFDKEHLEAVKEWIKNITIPK